MESPQLGDLLIEFLCLDLADSGVQRRDNAQKCWLSFAIRKRQRLETIIKVVQCEIGSGLTGGEFITHQRHGASLESDCVRTRHGYLVNTK